MSICRIDTIDKMREHQANIRIDKELWTEFKTKTQKQGSNATAEIIKFIEAYVEDNETSLETYPDLYIIKEVKEAIEFQLNDQFNEAVEAYEKILKHEIEKHYTELHQMYEYRLRDIEKQLGIEYDFFVQKGYSDKPQAELEAKQPKDTDSIDETNGIDKIDQLEEEEYTNNIYRLDSTDKTEYLDSIYSIDFMAEAEKNQEKILLSDKQLKEKESLSQHSSTIGRWRKGQTKIPNELLPIFNKYEIIGTKWAIKESA